MVSEKGRVAQCRSSRPPSATQDPARPRAETPRGVVDRGARAAGRRRRRGSTATDVAASTNLA
jgi:hypothetical protein